MTGKRRRGHNEGSIYQRDDGLWVATVSLGMVNGKRKRKYIYGRTRAEVNRKRIQLQNEHQRGVPVQTASTTMATFLDRWLATVKPTIRPKTFKSYEMIVQRHLVPALGRVKVEKVTQQHVQELMVAKTGEGLSVTNIRNVLRAALNQAMRWDLVARNVASLVKPPAAQQYEPIILGKEQAGRLLGVIEGDRLYALYALALSLGLRQGEVLGLRWEDVDLDRGRIMVRRQLQVIDGVQQLTEPKSKTSRRTIPLPTSLIEILRLHRKRQLEERILAGGRWQSQWDLVFTTPIGTPLDDSNLRKHFKDALKTAGLPEMRFHDMRHSAASMLAALGVHPSVAQRILGHANISTTLAIYTHVEQVAMREATDLMDGLFDREKEAN